MQGMIPVDKRFSRTHRTDIFTISEMSSCVKKWAETAVFEPGTGVFFSFIMPPHYATRRNPSSLILLFRAFSCCLMPIRAPGYLRAGVSVLKGKLNRQGLLPAPRQRRERCNGTAEKSNFN
jgi:hypothetical protein